MGFSGKSTGVGSHFLLQGIFLTQGSDLCLLHCRQSPALKVDLHHQGSPVWLGSGWNEMRCSFNMMNRLLSVLLMRTLSSSQPGDWVVEPQHQEFFSSPRPAACYQGGLGAQLCLTLNPVFAFSTWGRILAVMIPKMERAWPFRPFSQLPLWSSDCSWFMMLAD